MSGGSSEAYDGGLRYLIGSWLFLPDAAPFAAVGSDWKGKLSLALYLVGIGATFLRPWLGQLLFAAGAGLWLIPDRRVESSLGPD